MPISVFLSYARLDEALKKRLMTHLITFVRNGELSIWEDELLEGGVDYSEEITVQMNKAKIFLLLVSPDFIASEFIYSVELKAAMERHEQKTARVIPIILRSCNWRELPFAKLNVLPRGAVPAMEQANPDKAFADIAVGIVQAARHMQQATG